MTSKKLILTICRFLIILNLTVIYSGCSKNESVDDLGIHGANATKAWSVASSREDGGFDSRTYNEIFFKSYTGIEENTKAYLEHNDSSGKGFVIFSKKKYVKNQEIEIKLIDSDLKGVKLFPLRVYSTTDKTGEVVQFHEVGQDTGHFIGKIKIYYDLSFYASNDGILQVNSNDKIFITYIDGNYGRGTIKEIRAEANIEIVTPFIKDLRKVYLSDGNIRIDIETNALSQIKIVYREEFESSVATVSSDKFANHHSVNLANLKSGVKYKYRIIVRSTNEREYSLDNNRNWFQFKSKGVKVRRIFFEDFEGESLKFWDYDRKYWEFGSPKEWNEENSILMRPFNAYSGNKIIANNITKSIDEIYDYVSYESSTGLITPYINISEAKSQLILSFRRWIMLDGSDFARVWVSVDRGEWKEVLIHDSSPHLWGWQKEVIDLSNFIGGNNLRVRWTINVDYKNRMLGWSIDDVEITALDQKYLPTSDINTSPVANFSFIKEKEYGDTNITFSADSSLEDKNTYTWLFDYVSLARGAKTTQKLLSGENTVSLILTDEQGNIDFETRKIFIKALPTAIVGENKVIVTENSEQLISLDGSQSKKDYEINYHWELASNHEFNIELIGADTATPKYKAPEIGGGKALVLKWKLVTSVAADPNVVSSARFVTHTLYSKNKNYTPEISMKCIRGCIYNEDDNVWSAENKNLEIHINAETVNGMKGSLGVTGLPDGATFEDGILKWKVACVDSGVYNLKVLAINDNDKSLSKEKIITLHIYDADKVPVIESIDEITVREEKEFRVDVVAKDPEGKKLTYLWNNNFDTQTHQSSDALFMAPIVWGNTKFKLSVKVCDPCNQCSFKDVIVNVIDENPNKLPEVIIDKLINDNENKRIEIKEKVSIRELTVLNLDASRSSDPDGGPKGLIYKWQLDEGSRGRIIVHKTNKARINYIHPVITSNTEDVITLNVCDGNLEGKCSVKKIIVEVANIGALIDNSESVISDSFEDDAIKDWWVKRSANDCGTPFSIEEKKFVIDGKKSLKISCSSKKDAQELKLILPVDIGDNFEQDKMKDLIMSFFVDSKHNFLNDLMPNKWVSFDIYLHANGKETIRLDKYIVQKLSVRDDGLHQSNYTINLSKVDIDEGLDLLKKGHSFSIDFVIRFKKKPELGIYFDNLKIDFRTKNIAPEAIIKVSEWKKNSYIKEVDGKLNLIGKKMFSLDGAKSFDPDKWPSETVSCKWWSKNKSITFVNDNLCRTQASTLDVYKLTEDTITLEVCDGFDCSKNEENVLIHKSPFVKYAFNGRFDFIFETGSQIFRGESEVKLRSKIFSDGSEILGDGLNVLTYNWKQISGTPIEFSNKHSLNPVIVTPKVEHLTEDVLKFNLEVCYKYLCSNKDTEIMIRKYGQPIIMKKWWLSH